MKPGMVFERDDPRVEYRTNRRRHTTTTISVAWPWVYATVLNTKNGKQISCAVDASQYPNIRAAKKDAYANALKGAR